MFFFVNQADSPLQPTAYISKVRVCLNKILIKSKTLGFRFLFLCEWYTLVRECVCEWEREREFMIEGSVSLNISVCVWESVSARIISNYYEREGSVWVELLILTICIKIILWHYSQIQNTDLVVRNTLKQVHTRIKIKKKYNKTKRT